MNHPRPLLRAVSLVALIGGLIHPLPSFAQEILPDAQLASQILLPIVQNGGEFQVATSASAL